MIFLYFGNSPHREGSVVFSFLSFFLRIKIWPSFENWVKSRKNIDLILRTLSCFAQSVSDVFIIHPVTQDRSCNECVDNQWLSKKNRNKVSRYYHIAYLNQAAGMTLFTLSYNHLGSWSVVAKSPQQAWLCWCVDGKEGGELRINVTLGELPGLWDTQHRLTVNSLRNTRIPLFLT